MGAGSCAISSATCTTTTFVLIAYLCWIQGRWLTTLVVIGGLVADVRNDGVCLYLVRVSMLSLLPGFPI